jgi:hypothetical protein
MLQAVQLNTTKTFANSKAAPSKRAMKANRRQAMTATALGGVAVALAALSLNDLASGIALVSPNVSTWQAWALAIGIDAGFITTELVQLTISEKLRKAIAPLQPRPRSQPRCGLTPITADRSRWRGNAAPSTAIMPVNRGQDHDRIQREWVARRSALTPFPLMQKGSAKCR